MPRKNARLKISVHREGAITTVHHAALEYSKRSGPSQGGSCQLRGGPGPLWGVPGTSRSSNKSTWKYISISNMVFWPLL
jgi:hypothetical protein